MKDVNQKDGFPGEWGEYWMELNDKKIFSILFNESSTKDGDQADTFFKGGEKNDQGISTPKSGVTVVINGNICDADYDKNPLKIASMISHELMHAKILSYFETIVGDPNFSAGGNVWDKLLEELNVPNPNIKGQHDLFNEIFKDDLIKVLMDMNGDFNEDNKEKYLYLVLDNLAPNPEDNPANEDNPFNVGQVAKETWNLANTFVRINPSGNTLADYNNNVAEVKRLEKLSQSLYWLTDNLGNPIDQNGVLLTAGAPPIPIPYNLNQCPR